MRSRFLASLALGAAIAAVAGVTARAQTPEWAPTDREVASDYHGYSGSPLNLMLMFVSTLGAPVPDARGEFEDPWLRVHAVRDYYDFARMLQVHPAMRYSLCVSPALLDGIEEMTAAYDAWKKGGRPAGPAAGLDRWLRLSLTPSESLTAEEKHFIVERFFELPVRDYEQYHAGLRRLWDLRGKEPAPVPGDVLRRLGDDGLLDLVVWGNLAVFDPDFLNEKVTLPGGAQLDMMSLALKGKGYTRQDLEAVLDAQFAVMRALVPLYRELEAAGRLEIVSAPYADPVLPLLLDPQIARRSAPELNVPDGSPALAADAAGQVARAVASHSRRFGGGAPGMWLGAGGAEAETAALLVEHRVPWAAADEQALRATIRPGRMKIGERKRYAVYGWGGAGGTLALFFEDLVIPRDWRKNIGTRPWLEAANIFLIAIRQQQSIQRDLATGMISPVILPMDVPWSEFSNDGKDFLHSLLAQIEDSPWIRLVTPRQFLAEMKKRNPAEGLTASTPESKIYRQWVGSSAQNAAWRELARASEALAAVRKAQGEGEGTRRAERCLLRAQGRDLVAAMAAGKTSDPSRAESADRQFRALLAQAYRAIGAPASPALAKPLISASVAGAR